MTELEVLKAARLKIDDDDYWSKNASDLAEFIGCGDISNTPEVTGEFARQLFRDKFDKGIADEEMLQQKMSIASQFLEIV